MLLIVILIGGAVNKKDKKIYLYCEAASGALHGLRI